MVAVSGRPTRALARGKTDAECIAGQDSGYVIVVLMAAAVIYAGYIILSYWSGIGV